MLTHRLDAKELTDRLVALNRVASESWRLRENKLHREFVFGDFDEAFAFMTRVASLAREMNHHPNWSNVYSRVRVDLTTHDAGGVTDLDFALARKIERVS